MTEKRMTEREIQKLFVEDPQKLIDDQVVFEFEQMSGKVKLFDGVAAGGPWFIFEFVDGKYAGKKIACAADDIWQDNQHATFTYMVHESDDGMLFNSDPSRLTKEDDRWGGDYIPELDGKVFTVKKGDGR